MKTTDDLFELIHTMDAHEKGYFKKYAQLHGSGTSNHLRLFDALNRQTEYDEAQLLKKFRGDKLSGNLAVAKYYLYELVLKSLRAYRENNSVLMQVNALIENTETLFMKGMYAQGMKMLNKCAELCSQIDEPVKLLEVQTWQRKFIGGMSAHNTEQDMDTSIRESQDTLARIEDYTTLRKLYYKTNWLIRKNMGLYQGHIQPTLHEIMSHVLVADETRAQGFHQKLTLYNIHNVYHYLRGDHESAYGYMVKIVDLWETHASIRAQNTELYIAGLNNYVNACIFTGKTDELKRQLDNVDRIAVHGLGQKAKLFENVSLWKINYGIMAGDARYLLTHTADMEEGLQRYEGRIHEARPLVINNAIALTYFFNGEMEKTLHKINTVLAMKKIDMRHDIQAGLRIVNLFVHYELGNEDMLEHTLRATKRYLESRDYLTEYSKLVMQGLNKIMAKSFTRERMAAIAEFREALEHYGATNTDPHFRNDVLNLAILTWAEAKLADGHFADAFAAVVARRNEK